MKNIYILGGHKLSCSYYEKIKAAKEQGRIDYDGIFLVDDQPYHEFILTLDARRITLDAIIPDHTAKHVMLQVFMDLARKESFTPVLNPINLDIQTPYLNKLEEESIWAMSYATWTCPMYCDEPEVCPHTKKKRDWEMGEICSYEPTSPRTYDKQSTNCYSFSCEPLVDEIVFIPMESITNQIQDFQKKLKKEPPKEVFVFTHSHCHGILGKFKI